MIKRLTEKYPPGNQVDILFVDGNWRQGWVIKHDHPGIWVRTVNGRDWYVTNGRKIRRHKDEG